MADRADEIRARADAATPGPWETGSDGRYGRRVEVDPPGGEYREIAECSGYVQPTEDTVVNAEFIAHARSDIPYLLDRLAASEQDAARLRAEWEPIREALGHAVEAVQWLLDDDATDDDPGPGIRTDLKRWQALLREAPEAERAGPPREGAE